MNLRHSLLYRIQFYQAMNLLPTIILLSAASILHSQDILEPVSVYINQHGHPVIETYNPDNVELFEDDYDVVSSNNGYEIDNPCIYAPHWYKINPGGPVICRGQPLEGWSIGARSSHLL